MVAFEYDLSLGIFAALSYIEAEVVVEASLIRTLGLGPAIQSNQIFTFFDIKFNL